MGLRKTAAEGAKTERLNLMIEPRLKRAMRAYSNRHRKSISAIITDHFNDLLQKEKEPDVEQI